MHYKTFAKCLSKKSVFASIGETLSPFLDILEKSDNAIVWLQALGSKICLKYFQTNSSKLLGSFIWITVLLIIQTCKYQTYAVYCRMKLDTEAYLSDIR